jgi:sugar lactone lactonase YvrE
MKIPSLPFILCAAFVSPIHAAKVIPSNASADLVLGQADFVTGSSQPLSASSLQRPEGVVVDPLTRKVFVASYSNDRVLRFGSVQALANGASAEAVFGQSNFGGPISNSPLATNTNGPLGIHLDQKGRLWIPDASNNRVLMFEAAAYRSDLPSPDRVFGQADFTTNTGGNTAAQLSSPYSVMVDSSDRLWVADYNNNRVVFFNNISSKSNGASADGVIGQAAFGVSTSGTTNSKFSAPEGLTVSSDGTLFVADANNHRVLRFDNAATSGNGAAANAVLGQADFITSTSGLTDSKFNSPSGVGLDLNGALWVTDRNNERLLRFNAVVSKTNGAPADAVLGQPDFVTNTSSVSEKGSIDAYGRAFVDATGSLWIADTEHHRVLRFPADTTKPSITVTSNVPGSTTKAKLTVKGTASDAYGISKVQFQVNGASAQDATGTTTWEFKANLKVGKNTIKVFAVDSVGNRSVIKTLKVSRS